MDELKQSVIFLNEEIFFILSGEKGIITINCFPSLDSDKDEIRLNISHHTKKPQYYQETKSSSDCEFLGCPCYCDGRSFTVLKKKQQDILKFMKLEYDNLV